MTVHGAMGAPAPDAGPTGSVTPVVTVVGGRRGSVGVGRVVARELIREHRAACALLVLHRDPAPAVATSRPAVPRVRRRAQQLQASGISATAAGRVVTVGLDGTPAAAARATLTLAEGPDPVVLVLDGARDGAWDELLASSTRIVLVCDPSAPGVLATLAAADLAAVAPGVPIVPAAGSGGKRCDRPWAAVIS